MSWLLGVLRKITEQNIAIIPVVAHVVRMMPAYANTDRKFSQ